jgi:formylglycine-generating enzyme required for sulfatase activity
MFRFDIAAFVVLVLANWICVQTSAWTADNNAIAIGVSVERPASGPFVPIDGGRDGYMIPYTQVLAETGIQFEMIPVPGGLITIGSPDDEPGRSSDEGPQFQVEIAPMWVGKTEVTWNEFEGFMKTHHVFMRRAKAGMHKITASNRMDAITVPTPLYAASHHREFSNSSQHPAVTMTQYSAKQYTKWLSFVSGVQYRLPTEAEWEYAARAGSAGPYCFGDNVVELDQYAVYGSTLNEGAAVVASKQPNAFGLHDMHGNVWEWTIEQYRSQGYIEQAGKRFGGFDGTQWAQKMGRQCVRGGSWDSPSERVRSASRMGSDREAWSSEDPEIPTSPWWYTSDPARMVGMRVVRSASPLQTDEIKRFWENEIVELQDDLNHTIQEGRGREGIPGPELLQELKQISK